MSEQETGIPIQAAASPAWAKIERARHPQRPYPMDFIERIFTDFSEIHGDRGFADDPAIVCGMARFHGSFTSGLSWQFDADTIFEKPASVNEKLPQVLFARWRASSM